MSRHAHLSEQLQKLERILKKNGSVVIFDILIYIGELQMPRSACAPAHRLICAFVVRIQQNEDFSRRDSFDPEKLVTIFENIKSPIC